MLCGRLLFSESSSSSAILAQIQNAKFDFDCRREVSPAAQDMIRRLLELDPVRCLTATEGLQHPWITGAADNGSDSIWKKTTGLGMYLQPKIGDLERKSMQRTLVTSTSRRTPQRCFHPTRVFRVLRYMQLANSCPVVTGEKKLQSIKRAPRPVASSSTPLSIPHHTKPAGKAGSRKPTHGKAKGKRNKQA